MMVNQPLYYGEISKQYKTSDMVDGTLPRLYSWELLHITVEQSFTTCTGKGERSFTSNDSNLYFSSIESGVNSLDKFIVQPLKMSV